jgi:hypothetical protein
VKESKPPIGYNKISEAGNYSFTVLTNALEFLKFRIRIFVFDSIIPKIRIHTVVKTYMDKWG